MYTISIYSTGYIGRLILIRILLLYGQSQQMHTVRVHVAVDAVRVQHSPVRSGSATFICNEQFTYHFALHAFELSPHQRYYYVTLKGRVKRREIRNNSSHSLHSKTAGVIDV